jgi:hypothetical protein
VRSISRFVVRLFPLVGWGSLRRSLKHIFPLCEVHSQPGRLSWLTAAWCWFEFPRRASGSAMAIKASKLARGLDRTVGAWGETDPPLHIMVETANRMLSGRTATGQIATVVVGGAEWDWFSGIHQCRHSPFWHLSKGFGHERGAIGISPDIFPGVHFAMRRFWLTTSARAGTLFSRSFGDNR